MHRVRTIVNGVRGRFMIIGTLVFVFCLPLSGQQTANASVVDKDMLQLMLKRIDQLEARVRQLEAERQQGCATICDGPPSIAEHGPGSVSSATELAKAVAEESGPPQKPPASGSDSDQTQSDNVMAERMDVSKTLLRIRGFGDISLHRGTQKQDTTSFSLGQLDLFVTSDISEQFRFLSEIVFEGGPSQIYGTTEGQTNSFGVDVERYLLQYSRNDYFNISAGRGHTAIGYYNTAYHHSSWLQTTTGRPFLFDFEDRGGILPVHMVGVSVSGQVPSGSLGLHYVAEVGNGRASRSPLEEEPVQNEIDDQNHKAFNIAAFVRPEAIRGFQAGFSFYRDVLSPANSHRVGETIMAAHAILIRPKYEWLNEALLDRHTLLGTSSVFNTPGFYTQMSRQWSAYRPYFRYQYMNVANNEPVFPDVALRHGPTLGLRFDASEAVALKLQYDYTFLRNQPGVNELTLQLGFTF